MKKTIIALGLATSIFTACGDTTTTSPEVTPVKNDIEESKTIEFKNLYTKVIQCEDTFSLEEPMVIAFGHDKDGVAYLAQATEGEEFSGMWDEPIKKEGDVWKWEDGMTYNEKTKAFHEEDGSECGSTLIK